MTRSPTCNGWLGALALIASSTSIASAPVPSFNAEGVYVIEAESMRLSSAEALVAEGASGGKVVRLLDSTSVGVIELALKPGLYVLNAYFNGPDEGHDGFFLIADDKVRRTSSHLHNRYAYGAKFLIFSSDGKKPVSLRVASLWKDQPPAESGMLIDRLELSPFNGPMKLLERWMN
jgi:hypothetical protein